MNNFIFENSTKVYFGKGCVKEYPAYTDFNHGAGLAVLQPVYYRHIYQKGLTKDDAG